MSRYNPHTKKISMKNLLILNFFLENIKIKKYSVKYEDEIKNTIMSGYIHNHIKKCLLFPNTKCCLCFNVILSNNQFMIDALDNVYCSSACIINRKTQLTYVNGSLMICNGDRYGNLINCSICFSKNIDSQQCQICGFRKWFNHIEHWTPEGIKKFKICTKCKNNLGRKYKSTTLIC